LSDRGQFSIIAALLVAVILIATVIVTYSTIRNSPVQEQPLIQSAIDETNFAIKQILGFTVGYYGSVLQVTGNSTYAKNLALNYLQTGLVNIANMHPQWGTSFNVTKSDLYTFWFTNASYSTGNLTITYNLVGLGISGMSYKASSRLGVNVMNTASNQAYLNISKDENEPLINLGKQNFKFYRYVDSSSTWELVSPSNEPIAYANGTYQIDIPSGVDPDSYLVEVADPRGIIVVASSYSRYSCAITWNPSGGSRYAVAGSTSEILGAPDGNYVTVEKGATCEVTGYKGGTALIKQVYFNMTYYGSNSGTLEWYYRLDGGSWNKIEDLPEGGNASSPLTRTYNATGLRASWTWEYLNTTNIRFRNNFNNDNASVDAIYVTVAYSIVGNYSTIPNETLVVEVLQNGTMRWLGESLISETSLKPIPPIPVRSIHVNQTTNDVSSEVPFQVEDWTSEYRIPLGLANNASVFSSKTMLVFLATPSVQKVTIWWNGSDMAAQTPLAYTNRYFTGDNEASGVLTNGILTLQFVGNFQVNSTVGTSTCNAKFMRVNGQDSTYGSGKPAYVITKGIVRDVVHQEAEFSGGVTNCPNFYAHIVLTLPANTTFYTYQLRVMFVQSQQNRTITELRPIRTVTYPTSQPQTENGTANGYPIVSNATDVSFYNQSTQCWAHHWSQFISGTKGSGIMYRDSANVGLYSFDSKAASKTGTLKVSTNTGERKIEFAPITMTTVYNFTSALDVIWYGAVVTFDGTTPIYKEQSGTKTGLWITVECPPTISISTES
jgi:hypothetical protein